MFVGHTPDDEEVAVEFEGMLKSGRFDVVSVPRGFWLFSEPEMLDGVRDGSFVFTAAEIVNVVLPNHNNSQTGIIMAIIMTKKMILGFNCIDLIK